MKEQWKKQMQQKMADYRESDIEVSWAELEEALAAKGVIPTAFGEDLSWEYLRYVREHPVRWSVPTKILYGSRDSLTGIETIQRRVIS